MTTIYNQEDQADKSTPPLKNKETHVQDLLERLSPEHERGCLFFPALHFLYRRIQLLVDKVHQLNGLKRQLPHKIVDMFFS
jgi:hypothetical protein